MNSTKSVQALRWLPMKDALTVESAKPTPEWADLRQCKFLLHWAVHMWYKSYTRVSHSTYTHKIQRYVYNHWTICFCECIQSCSNVDLTLCTCRRMETQSGLLRYQNRFTGKLLREDLTSLLWWLVSILLFTDIANLQKNQRFLQIICYFYSKWASGSLALM